MKKIFLAAIVLFGINASVHAQTKTATAKKEAAPAAQLSKTAISAPGNKATTVQTVTSAKAAAPAKNDGTPDMRFKANREAAKAAPKLKKDGTPDLRYKKNKNQ